MAVAYGMSALGLTKTDSLGDLSGRSFAKQPTVSRLENWNSLQPSYFSHNKIRGYQVIQLLHRPQSRSHGQLHGV
jgi:hypothetical protein